MEPIWGLILFIGLTVCAGLIAGRKGRSAATFSLGGLAAGVVLGFGAVFGFHGDGMAAGTGFILGPLGAFLAALFARRGERVAADGGTVAGYRKCPYCAEAIRAEAIKCRHCGSEVGQQVAEP